MVQHTAQKTGDAKCREIDNRNPNNSANTVIIRYSTNRYYMNQL